MITRHVLLSTILASALMHGAIDPANAAAPTRPNIVVIVSDDHGFGDIGWNNPQVATPHLDQLARDGVRLDRFYANPICSVTRGALMSGFASLRTGVNNASGLELKYQTLPAVLQKAGYQTWMCGKWHLGGSSDNRLSGPEYLPHHRGFDYFYGHLHGAIDYYRHERKDLGELDWQRNGQPVVEEGFSTDLLADDAIRLIRKRDSERPFFLYLAFNAVHGPLQPPPGVTGLGKRDRRPTLLANLTYLDQAIGRVLAAIHAEHLEESTLIVFLGDNGGQLNQGASNGSLRGEKGETFEGGIRVPAAMRWTGQLRPAVSQQFLCVTDLFPTLCAAAQVPLETPQPLDGANLWPSLRSGQVTDRPPFVMGNKDVACFAPPWKLVVDSRGENRQLFQIVNDPQEQTDVAAQHAEIVERLSQTIEKQRSEAPRRGGKKKGQAPGKQNKRTNTES